MIDGYYGLGVPRRLAVLPWHFGLGLRTISHTNLDQVDWPTLSLLNVKYLKPEAGTHVTLLAQVTQKPPTYLERCAFARAGYASTSIHKRGTRGKASRGYGRHK